MDIISSKAHFRQRVVKRSYKIGVTKASYYYKVSRNAIYEWRNKYNGTVKSLRDGSHKPHHHPKEHTQAEKDMILRRYNRYEGDLIRMWDALRENGYSRHYNRSTLTNCPESKVSPIIDFSTLKTEGS